MKKIRITITMDVSDELYEKEFLEMKNNILSGKIQRDMVGDPHNKGITKCTATFEDITNKN